MIIEGRAIAQTVLAEVARDAAQLTAAPRLAIITACPTFETQKYLALKKRTASQVGISTSVIELLEGCTTDEVVQTVKTAAEQSDGIVVQLPLPAAIDTNRVLAAIPTTHDVDGIHYDGESGELPPVVGAIAAIAELNGVQFAGKQVVIIGAGRLVGAPALLWVTEQAGNATTITRDTPDTESAAALAAADIIISGAGSPGLITPEKIKDGAVIFDAGTSEEGGALVGDADPACAEKAAVFTPVPGGIGPITIACLLKNLIALTRQ